MPVSSRPTSTCCVFLHAFTSLSLMHLCSGTKHAVDLTRRFDGVSCVLSPSSSSPRRALLCCALVLRLPAHGASRSLQRLAPARLALPCYLARHARSRTSPPQPCSLPGCCVKRSSRHVLFQSRKRFGNAASCATRRYQSCRTSQLCLATMAVRATRLPRRRPNVADAPCSPFGVKMNGICRSVGCAPGVESPLHSVISLSLTGSPPAICSIAKLFFLGNVKPNVSAKSA